MLREALKLIRAGVSGLQRRLRASAVLGDDSFVVTHSYLKQHRYVWLAYGDMIPPIVPEI